MKKYFIITILALVCLQMVQAQTENYLLYKEYDPDYWVVVTPGQQYDIDINDDGIADVRYRVFLGNIGLPISEVNTVNGWLACNYCSSPWGSGHDNFFYDQSVPLNDTSLVWGGSCLFEAFVQYPNVTPLVYKVALRYRDGEDYYYGWAEFEEIREASNGRGRFHVAQTCYCAIPNYPLHWGQTSLTDDLAENESAVFAIVYPNPTNGRIAISGPTLKQAEVVNALGQRVATAKGKDETLQIDIANLPAGVYFVNITDEDGRKCVRKVVKE